MKHMRLSTFGRVLYVTTIPLLFSACSGSLNDAIENVPLPDHSTLTTDSILRFASIEEFESMSAEKISNNLSGYDIAELTYECIDTIELRALRFDVNVKLVSTEGDVKRVNVRADVGPELVSVEYYPTGEWVPPHDNMAFAFYPCVERYRNYSDGSRIGPDLFYDYGHFHHSYISIYVNTTALLSWNTDNFGNAISSEVKYENGVLCKRIEEQIEVNVNATVIMPDGSRFTGDDLIPHHPKWWDKVSIFAPLDRFKYALGCYYDDFPHPTSPYLGGYMESRGINTDDEDTAYIVNLCKDVPDVSPTPFPTDTKSLSPGWYFGDVVDGIQTEPFAYSNLHSSTPGIYYDDEFGYGNGFQLYDLNDCYLQYLVIDGRIIHFDNLARDYMDIWNLKPEISEIKTSYGYNIHREMSHKYIGANIKTIYDLHIKCTEGPEVTIDYSNPYEMGNVDQDEINKINTTSRKSRSKSETRSCVEREDRRYISIDRRLPNSINSLNLTHTLK